MNEEKIKKEVLIKLQPYGFENFSQQNQYGLNALMFCLKYNKTMSLGLDNNEWDYLIQNSDLNITNENANNLIYALNYFEAQDIRLTTKQWDYLIRNSDIKQKMNDKTSLIYFVFFNNRKEINIEENTLNYFIENSDLHHQDQNGWTAFLYALRSIEKNPKNESYIKKIYSCLSEEEKQETFYKICEKYIGITKEFNQNHILFMLYDLQMKPTKETLEKLNKDERYQDKLIKNQYQELIQMIEKRDVLWDLNKNLNQEKNKKDVLKI